MSDDNVVIDPGGTCCLGLPSDDYQARGAGGSWLCSIATEAGPRSGRSTTGRLPVERVARCHAGRAAAQSSGTTGTTDVVKSVATRTARNIDITTDSDTH